MTLRACVEMIATRHPEAREMEAYERVLTDAMAGDPTLFARQDYVEKPGASSIPCCETSLPRSLMNRIHGAPAIRVLCYGGWDNPKSELFDDVREARC